MDTPATVAIRSPIPLETDLTVTADHDGTWRLVDPEEATILEATMWVPDCPVTEPVTIAEARAARDRFMLPGGQHPVPECFACGQQPDTMGVHAGPLGDGRFATDWTIPAWAAMPGGATDAAVVWGALDCTAAWYVGCEGGIRHSVTAQLAVQILEPLIPEESYALVSWAGDWESGGWQGRKRGAASAAFDETGRCVAQSTSFWIALQ